jgi:alpha-methylacyl-CoA racemase
MARSGPLVGLKVLEFAGLGPAPFCGMLLSDMGADVVRIDRKGTKAAPYEVTFRGRRSVAMDLKAPGAAEACLKLAETCDALIEGFRPGVMERLGLGPDVVLARNPKLVYGRMTGWGQTGAHANSAGHDIDYVAMSGALHAIGGPEKPAIPLNLVGDYGGGALYLAFGVLAGILHARESGEGQVIDCAMADGAISLMTQIFGHLAGGRWHDQRGINVIDGGTHFYNVYQCKDGEWLAVGAIEPQFYKSFLQCLGIDDADFGAQWDPARWPGLKEKIAAVIRTKTRDEWCAVLAGADACAVPVLSLKEAIDHPAHKERGSFVDIAGIPQPAPAPRFSKTPGAVQSPPPEVGADSREALADWGFGDAEIAALETSGVI